MYHLSYPSKSIIMSTKPTNTRCSAVPARRGEEDQIANEEDPQLPPQPTNPFIRPTNTVNANQLAVLAEFSGSPEEDIDHFCLQVHRCREAFGWTHEVTAQMVQTQLKGAALTWFRGELTLGSDTVGELW